MSRSSRTGALLSPQTFDSAMTPVTRPPRYVVTSERKNHSKLVSWSHWLPRIVAFNRQFPFGMPSRNRRFSATKLHEIASSG
jgi:hypothetical protein